MQEHQSRVNSRKGNDRFADANFKLSESARKSVIGVANSFVGREDFASAYLAEQYLTKYCDESLTPAATRRKAAVDKWLECERRNASTNERLRTLDPGYNILPRVSASSFLRFARRLLREILGPLRDEVVLGSFSGGASTSRKRTEGHPALKFVGKADSTEPALIALPVLKRLAPLLEQYQTFDEIEVVEGAVLFTVPKKTDIDRCACKEPDINMFLQKGVGDHIRRRLRRFGINLNDQRINKELAFKGAVTNDLATLDLSSASDTITIECVRLLLPPIWFEYLNDIRSQVVVVDGENHRTEMFSSMGNGFTFELESLIFFVLMRTVAYFEGISGVISVYGDDLIIPSGMYGMASWVLQHFGFAVNMDKSFHDGPFRESCGGHYYRAEDVTPFYLKRAPTRLTDVIRVANQLRRWAVGQSEYRQYEVPGLYQLWLGLASYVPKGLWGGYDYSLDTKLVSPPVVGAKSYQLQRLTDEVKLPARGAFLEWHNNNWNRSQLPDKPGADPVSTNQKCRRRRTKPGAPVCLDWFYEELV
ncbi:MAG: RNA replicase beta chain [Sanya fiers-like virus 5]|nr:MAG: RNA replicase beta chain [Sanya fiers-like virus 5]